MHFMVRNYRQYNVVSPPIKLVQGLFPRVQRGRDVKLSTHFHLVPQLRTGGGIQGDSNMTGTDLYNLYTNQSRSYLNHLVNYTSPWRIFN
jgi:hypothetical protein